MQKHLCRKFEHRTQHLLSKCFDNRPFCCLGLHQKRKRSSFFASKPKQRQKIIPGEGCCIAQRQDSCFLPSRPGFNSLRSQKFYFNVSQSELLACGKQIMLIEPIQCQHASTTSKPSIGVNRARQCACQFIIHGYTAKTSTIFLSLLRGKIGFKLETLQVIDLNVQKESIVTTAPTLVSSPDLSLFQ